MKIVYILSLTNEYGGASKSFLLLLKNMISRLVEVIVVVPDRNGIYNTLVELGCEVCVLTYRNNTYPRSKTLKEKILFFPRLIARLIVNNRASKKLAVYLKGKNVDIIHTNVSVINIGFNAARELNIPHIYHFREYGDLDFNLHYFPTWSSFYKKIDVQGSYAISITKGIQRHHHLHGKDTSCVIYNGIFDKESYSEKTEKKPYFLFAGRIEYPKGLDLLLAAYIEYARKVATPYKLLIAGGVVEHLYYAELKRLVSDNQLSDKVIFIGERTDLDVLMSEASAVVVPSRNEGFGRCMPEAMFYHSLVIGHNTGGTKEQMDNGLELTGEEIALRYDTVGELVECLVKVTTEPQQSFSSIIKRAFYTVNTLYQSEVNAEKIYTFYNDIIYGSHN